MRREPITTAMNVAASNRPAKSLAAEMASSDSDSADSGDSQKESKIKKINKTDAKQEEGAVAEDESEDEEI